MPIMLAALLVQAVPAAAAPAAGPDLTRMAALYDEACLQTFPIGGQLEALMARKRAVPLTADQVKLTLRDDPGRGWTLADGDQTYLVILELPPFHACSVRTSLPAGPLDLSPYEAIAKRFEASHAGFATQPPADFTRDGFTIHAVTAYRTLPGGTGEHLMVIDQQVAEPKRRAAGETGRSLRFVHQIATGG